MDVDRTSHFHTLFPFMSFVLFWYATEVTSLLLDPKYKIKEFIKILSSRDMKSSQPNNTQPCGQRYGCRRSASKVNFLTYDILQGISKLIKDILENLPWGLRSIKSQSIKLSRPDNKVFCNRNAPGNNILEYQDNQKHSVLVQKKFGTKYITTIQYIHKFDEFYKAYYETSCCYNE